MGRQRGATGGMGTASGSNREASMYVCIPTACPHKAFSSVPLMDIQSSQQGVSSLTGTLSSQLNVFLKENLLGLFNILLAFVLEYVFIAMISESVLPHLKALPLCSTV